MKKFKFVLSSLALSSFALLGGTACSGDGSDDDSGVIPGENGGETDENPDDDNDDETPDDMEEPDLVSLDCANGAVPDVLEIAGVVEDIVGRNAAAGVTLEVFPAGATASISSVTTDPSGNYALSIPTNGQPWIGEIRASSDDYIPMHVFPSGLKESSEALTIPALTPQARQLASTLAGVTLDPNDALVIGFIFDCDEMGLEGATMSSDLESGDFVYLLDDAPFVDESQTSTAPSGVGVVLNAVSSSATPGKAKIGAQYGERDWEVDVDVIPGEVSIALFIP